MNVVSTEQLPLIPNRATRRKVLSDLILETDQLICSHFPDSFDATDCYGLSVTKLAVQRYLSLLHEHSVEVVHECIARNVIGRIAEVGVGFGNNLLPLKKHYGNDVVGFDLKENLPCYGLAIEAERIPLFPYDICDESSNSIDGNFDGVILSEVLEHLFIDVGTVAARLKDFVRIGGIAVVTTPNIYRLSNLIRMFHGRNLNEPHPAVPRTKHGYVVDGRTHPREYTMFEVAEAFCQPAGWRLLGAKTVINSVLPQGFTNYLRALATKALFRFPMKEFIIVTAERIS